ncbi:MAG: hypothetical protein CL807_08715 [Citromicrobium sp.]|jgi:hypothetical protein|nr:hypothetical protein [Citromicrobium sp.]MBD76952.1 hypothetical protein [Citromicrobium sp.]|tara:strand:+ start:1054 stop:1554 length:501 start_codon:yes stop_codon:yes gene_type:complete
MRIEMAGILAPVLALALAGCGEPPGGTMGNDTAEKIDGDVRQIAGLYRERITIEGPANGGAGSQYGEDEKCLTEDDVKDGHRAMLLSFQGDACKFEKYDLEGSTLDAVLVCKADAYQPETRGSITGTVTPTGSNLRMTYSGLGSGEGAVGMRVESERIGDCAEEGK